MTEADRPSQPGRIEHQAQGVLCFSGDWTLPHYAMLRRQVERFTDRRSTDRDVVDLSRLGALDTAGAVLLVELIGTEQLAHLQTWAPKLPAERQALLCSVADAVAASSPLESGRALPVRDFLGATGQQVESLWQQQRLLLGFIGQVLVVLARLIWHPSRWRLTALVSQIHRTGLNALPIVALLTFLVGAVVAFLGTTVLRDFGATIYTVNLVAFAFLREFGVLLAAILLAGRTASAFTAQLGAMKANEELDAIRTLGLDPIELLVLPRVLAMIVTLPILTFVGMLSGMLGGAMVCSLALDISAFHFLSILQRDIPLEHLLVGISKAPLFAFLVGVIGCLEGFKVSGSAQSVGEHTTSSVVQSIFMVILLDALAALFFMEMGW
ncbi:MlaE family ABC transporter permease [Candidatus Nitrotoga sp. M5]|uniref:MlaE family ABC transporter permease n=1 Tax=Candidatus Nitrotoga sp. M5 TaxID=2890409 RepID=UPI001EF2E38B|nr:ABC transporter permease [Candidatus Nitrotoga sp. M5]CAH1386423.1 Intermembrane phospholipid transport system permease protein MlaE [Candidatus Nitrotoga sp. M5]